MLGVIMCGGKSSRMGSDKGLLKTPAGNWAKLAANKLESLGLPVVFSVNEKQFEQYSKSFPGYRLIPDNTTIDIEGPLAGLISVYQQFPEEDVLVLACDMVLMNISLLSQLYVHAQQCTEEAVVFTINGEIEPLCAVYKAIAFLKILKLYQEEKLLKHSLKYALAQLNACYISLSPLQQLNFCNFNTPEDLQYL